MQLTIKVLHNIKSVLNFSNDFESVIKKWHEEQTMLWKKSEISHINKEKLNVNDIIWLLGKENVVLNADKEYINVKKIIETPDHKTSVETKSGDEKETQECRSKSYEDENPETNSDGEESFEYPETFMGINLNMFKSENFQTQKESKRNEKSATRQTMSEAIIDAIYETERKKGRRKRNEHDKPKYIDVPEDVPDLLDDMGTIMFPGMDSKIKQDFGEKDGTKNNKCNKPMNNIDHLDHLSDERKSQNKYKSTVKLDTNMNEASMSKRKNPKYINVDVNEKGTADMIGDLLNEAKELKLNLGSLSDLGMNQFQELKIPILEDVFDDNEEESEIEEYSKDGKWQEGDQERETNPKRTLEDEENDNRDEL